MDVIEGPAKEQGRSLQGSPAAPRRRRRGAVLEAALLDAVWHELAENGYSELTYEAVAARAGTSRGVIYRRWPTKPEMVLAAITHRGAAGTAMSPPGTGSLRTDLLALLRSVNTHRAEETVMFGTHLGPFFKETGISPAIAWRSWVDDRDTGIDEIYERAIGRGEIDAARVIPRTRRVALDLWRHDVFMRMGPIPDARIVEIVDDVALPLVTRRLP